MIALVATLVERSRGADLRLQLSQRDYNAIAGGKVKCDLPNYYRISHRSFGAYFVCFAGISIPLSTNQRQHQSASDAALDSCAVQMGRTPGQSNHFNAVFVGDAPHGIVRSVFQIAHAADGIVGRSVRFAMLFAIGVTARVGCGRILSPIGTRLACGASATQ